MRLFGGSSWRSSPASEGARRLACPVFGDGVQAPLQVDGADLLLPFRHVAPPFRSRVSRSWGNIGPFRDPQLIVEAPSVGSFGNTRAGECGRPASSPTDPIRALQRTLDHDESPWPLAASFAALLLVGGSASAGGNPWNLQCASMPAERSAPAPLRDRRVAFLPLGAPSSQGAALRPRLPGCAVEQDRDLTRRRLNRQLGYYLHRALIAVAPSYQARVTVTGHRLGKSRRRAALGFSTNGATACTVNPPDVSCGSRPLRFAAPSLSARAPAGGSCRPNYGSDDRLLRDRRLRSRVARRDPALGARPRLRHHRLVTAPP